MCVNCGLSVSEIKNHVLMQSNIPDIEKYQENIVHWIFMAESQIGTFNGLHKYTNIELSNSSPDTKILLPDNMYTLDDVCVGGVSIRYSGEGSNYNSSCGCGGGDNNCSCYTWFVNGCYLQFSSKVSKVTISYTAIPTDEEGFPLVNRGHLMAIVSFIKYMLLQSRFDDGKIPMGIYQTRYREWISRKTAARALDEVPTGQEMELLANIYNAKLPVSIRRGFAYNNFNSIIIN
jgi:hypothetical protein